MEIELTVFSERENEVIILKDFICDYVIVDDIYIKRLPDQEGTLGGDLLTNTIVTIIKAATEPLTALVKCLNTYISLHKTDLEISVNDKKIKISSKNPQELEHLIKSILENLPKE